MLHGKTMVVLTVLHTQIYIDRLHTYAIDVIVSARFPVVAANV